MRKSSNAQQSASKSSHHNSYKNSIILSNTYNSNNDKHCQIRMVQTNESQPSKQFAGSTSFVNHSPDAAASFRTSANRSAVISKINMSALTDIYQNDLGV